MSDSERRLKSIDSHIQGLHKWYSTTIKKCESEEDLIQERLRKETKSWDFCKTKIDSMNEKVNQAEQLYQHARKVLVETSSLSNSYVDIHT